MEHEVSTNTQGSPGWLLGAVLIGLGALFLVNQIIPGFMSGLIWASAFGVGAVATYGYYTRNRQQWWALIPAYVMAAIASLILLGMVRFIPGEVTGAFVMALIGAPFLYVYLRDRRHWWALIPAYTMGAIGGIILLSGIIRNDMLIASYVMYAIAAPFLYVYLRNRQHWWALIPGGIMAVMGTAFMVSGLAYLIPVLLIVVGIYLLVRHFGGQKATSPAAPVSTPRPTSGPEADRPVTEFTPIGAAQSRTPESGPEADY